MNHTVHLIDGLSHRRRNSRRQAQLARLDMVMGVADRGEGVTEHGSRTGRTPKASLTTPLRRIL